ncbi:molybdopterin-containing oxidoreductase catalytic subunit [Salmonella enterica subsp. enterica]|nr:molybdopterin-containing oxidoreductase catalytic subunit [Salmonella enterica subsp. enterica]
MLWVACKNPFAQDFDRQQDGKKRLKNWKWWSAPISSSTKRCQHADIVLPVTTAFEEWNVDASYWHYWLSINQPAIKPMYEAKMRP